MKPEEKIEFLKERIKLLKQLQNDFYTERQFTKGDMVVFKRGMRTMKYPGYGLPAIVSKVYEKPIPDPTKDSCDADYGQQLDIVIGVLTSSGKFLQFHLDSRRLELVDPSKDYSEYDLGLTEEEDEGPKIRAGKAFLITSGKF